MSSLSARKTGQGTPLPLHILCIPDTFLIIFLISCDKLIFIRCFEDGLLKWLQARTFGYEGVNVADFTKSWENGMRLFILTLPHSVLPCICI